jgi:predicted permease
MPVATITILYLGGWIESYPLLTRFLVIESAVPPAAGLILQVRTYGGDRDLVGGIMLVSYIACIVTIPITLLVLSHIMP